MLCFGLVRTRLVLRGQILKALELLYAHSERRTQTQTKRRVAKSTKNNIWLKTEVLLKHTPVLREGESLMQFEADWDQWRADCRYDVRQIWILWPETHVSCRVVSCVRYL